MTRVKRGVIATKKRRKILRYTKGFRWGRSHKERAAREALLHAWTHAFQGRKNRKRDFRSLWQVKINAALNHQPELSYSRFINLLKKADIQLNRKILANLAEKETAVFQKIISSLPR